jgi:ADP-ribose pyrophosphatase
MDSIKKYLSLVEGQPTLFEQNDKLKLVLDIKVLNEYSQTHGTQLGIVYEAQNFLFCVDLVVNEQNVIFPYPRLLSKNATNGVVIIPRVNDRYILLKQFRHATRNLELEFPRGNSEIGILPSDNAKKELYEEIGAVATQVEYLGAITVDSAVRNSTVDLFFTEIDKMGHLQSEEGIVGVELLSASELISYIKKGIIRDCFSICAWYKYLLHSKEAY